MTIVSGCKSNQTDIVSKSLALHSCDMNPEVPTCQVVFRERSVPCRHRDISHRILYHSKPAWNTIVLNVVFRCYFGFEMIAHPNRRILEVVPYIHIASSEISADRFGFANWV